jgi:beta-lactamase class A
MHILALLLALQLPPQKSDAVIGVSALHLETGQRIGIRGSERFPMGSVYKVPIALTVLHEVDAGRLRLAERVTIEPKDFAPGWSPLRDEAKGKPVTRAQDVLLRLMVSVSDNTASDYFLRRVGGAAVVTERMRELGIDGIRIDRSETEMAKDLSAPGGADRYAIDPRDTATPDAMVALLEAFWRGRDGLSPESHEHLLRLMIESKTGARRIKSRLPRGSIVAHKTGTMPGTTNDAAIITSPDGKQHIAIAIFLKAAKTSPDADCEADIAAIAKAVYEALTGTTEISSFSVPRMTVSDPANPISSSVNTLCRSSTEPIAVAP